MEQTNYKLTQQMVVSKERARKALLKAIDNAGDGGRVELGNGIRVISASKSEIIFNDFGEEHQLLKFNERTVD